MHEWVSEAETTRRVASNNWCTIFHEFILVSDFCATLQTQLACNMGTARTTRATCPVRLWSGERGALCGARARCGYHIREGAVNTGSSYNNKLQQVQKLICMHEIAKWAETRPRHIEAPDSHFPVICYKNPSKTKPTTNSWAQPQPQPRRQTSVSDLHTAIVCLAMRLV